LLATVYSKDERRSTLKIRELAEWGRGEPMILLVFFWPRSSAREGGISARSTYRLLRIEKKRELSPNVATSTGDVS
jgi:hypothetical protein